MYWDFVAMFTNTLVNGTLATVNCCMAENQRVRGARY